MNRNAHREAEKWIVAKDRSEEENELVEDSAEEEEIHEDAAAVFHSLPAVSNEEEGGAILGQVDAPETVAEESARYVLLYQKMYYQWGLSCQHVFNIHANCQTCIHSSDYHHKKYHELDYLFELCRTTDTRTVVVKICLLRQLIQ